MLKVVHEENETNAHAPVAVGGSMLDELVRDGARQMLAAALQAEVAAYVGAHQDEIDEDGHRLVVRNGYHAERAVATGAGAVPVRAPRVNDKRTDEETGERKRFSSAILPAWARKSPQVAEVLPLLYLHGLSSLDFGPALEQFLGSTARACRRPRSPGSPASGKTMRPRSTSDPWPTPTTSTAGSTASTSRSASSRTRCACW
jgi:putative transposase